MTEQPKSSLLRPSLSRPSLLWERILLFSFVLAAFALRLYRLGAQELRGDEAFGYFFSLQPLPEIVAATLTLREPHPVAAYYLQHFWLQWAGHSEFALRFASAGFGLLAVALLYALGRELLHKRSALLATLLLASAPYAIWHSQDARMYSMSLALTLAATWLMVLWLQRQRWSRQWSVAAAYLLVSWLALHTHYFAVFVLAAHTLFVLVTWAGFWPGSATSARTVGQWVVMQAVLALSYLPWLLRVRGILDNYGGNGDSPTLIAMLWRALSVFAVGESTPTEQRPWWALLALLLLLLGGWQLWRQQGSAQRRALPLLVLYLAVPLFVTWWSARDRPIFNERYLVAALPAFFLLTAAALPHHRPAWRGWVTAPLLLLLIGGMGLALQRHYDEPAYSKSRGWRTLAATLTDWSAGLPPDRVRIAQNFPDPTLWYYYRGAVEHVVLPPAAADAAGARKVVAELAADGVERILLPRQPAPHWDASALADAALATAYNPVLTQQVGNWPLVLYSRPPATLTPVAATFENGLQLDAFAVAPRTIVPAGVLVLHLAWQRAGAALAGSEKVFVHLLDAQGQLVAQDDRLFNDPAGATEQASVYGILLPENLAAEPHRLVVGLYDPTLPTSPRVLTTSGADSVELLILPGESIQ